MTTTYSLKNFIDDLDRITRTESSQEKIVNAAKPLLARLVQQPNCIEEQYRKRGVTAYGRYMLHRAPLFNVSSVVWGPGDNAKAHNHDTWGMVGVIENEIQETRFRRKDDGRKCRPRRSRGHGGTQEQGWNGFMPGIAQRRYP